MREEPIELDYVNTIVGIPYSPEIDRIEIADAAGRELLPDYSDDLSEIAAQGKLFYETAEGSRPIRVLADDAALIAGISEIKSIVLTEENGEPVYAISGTREDRFLGIFTVDVEAEVSAEDGELLSFEKPWWVWV